MAEIGSMARMAGSRKRTGGVVLLLVLLGGVAQAQAPAPLSALYAEARKARQAAEALLVKTDEWKAYRAALNVEQALEARVKAEGETK